MVRGLNSFKEWFDGYESQYSIIGGTACEILMTRAGLGFRATKDIDIVLIVETMSVDFGKRLWEYVLAGGYKWKMKSNGKPCFYRFTHPESDDFPAMIELFSAKPDSIALSEKCLVTPLPIDEEVSSLSAILLNEDYYRFLRNGSVTVNGISVLSAPHLIAFKAKAWMDLLVRNQNGEHVDARDIRKHKNDVFRLTELLRDGNRIIAPKTIVDDMKHFVELVQGEEIDLKQLGIAGRSKEHILEELQSLFTEG